MIDNTIIVTRITNISVIVITIVTNKPTAYPLIDKFESPGGRIPFCYPAGDLGLIIY